MGFSLLLMLGTNILGVLGRWLDLLFHVIFSASQYFLNNHFFPFSLTNTLRQANTPQRADKTTIGRALEQGVIANQTLAYFIGRTALFAKRIGLREVVFFLIITENI